MTAVNGQEDNWIEQAMKQQPGKHTQTESATAADPGEDEPYWMEQMEEDRRQAEEADNLSPLSA